MIDKHPLYNEIKDGLCGRERLFDYLRDSFLIHHATRKENLLKILSCNEIKFNDNSFEHSYPQSRNCYAKHHKCISLFNLATPTIKQIIEVIDHWVSFTAKNNVLICFDIKKLSKKIILNENFKDKATKLKKMKIGYIEDLYPISLNIKLAKSFIVINGDNYKEYPNIPIKINQLKQDL